MFQFEDGAPRAKDHVIDAFGVRVYVDPKSMTLVKGTTIDFETGMRGHGFRFDNPNTSNSCGCGESITF
jgi:iron-sulfur cluster assembly protein